ncbi:endonuclease/exonuclease/phosphatase family protein [Planctomyces sp. SH-PL14]|uniref:endonuclease/exonuclease/phosphatase family protein n=1 Tax=Planctomyces sp. SH-PL14 TaxID=1632864 RepID=UPI00078DCFD7|nr:endonuclease/exonuclease/phosphatase family protein [Planctomyces sp. SH-PL14]AMV18658.1 Endonuclease/Exonuclease/phosphatase family protein [Planctomyces sp. SH-PL14]
MVGLSALLAVLAAALLLTQPDRLAWLLMFPRWVCLGPGCVLLLLGRSAPRRWLGIAALLWGLYAGLFVEEGASLTRLGLQGIGVRTAVAGDLRVVSLNCGSGSERAVDEALAWQPDLLCLQECPGRPQLETLVRSRPEEWSLAAGPDAAILARGRLTVRQQSARGVWIWATWHRAADHPAAGDIEVVSLRLHPVPVRLDPWSGDCWESHSRIRAIHRQEIDELLTALEAAPADARFLICGDFNAPAGDRGLDALRKVARDSFREAGVGWGNTILNDFPVHRIDQVWVSPHIEARRVWARKSSTSDHRAAIADLSLQR